MSLELQLSVSKAEGELKRIEAAIAAFQRKLETLKNTQVSIDLSGIKIPTNSGELANLSKGLNALSKIDASRIDAAATALGKFAGIGLGSAAGSVQALATALKQITIPRNLERTATNIGNIGLAANSAISRVNSFKTSLNGIQAPRGLSGLNSQFASAGNAARSASGGISAFNTVLGAIGVTGGAAGLKMFIDSATEAATTVTQFGNKMVAALGDVPDAAKQSADSLAFVRQAAERLALPLDTSMHGFSKLAVSMVAAGNSMEQVQGVFLGFNTGFRALGLNAAQIDRAMNAVNQTFSKGTVSMEELRQQLGEVFPAFQELARSTGMSTEELIKNIAQGKVSSQTFLKLAEDIGTKYGPAAEKAANTGQAALQRYSNAIFEFKARFGAGYFDGIKDGLNSLTEALNTEAFRQFGETLGSIVGTAIGFVSQGLALVAGNVYALSAAFTVVGGIAAGIFIRMSSLLLSLIPGFGLLRGALSLIGTAVVQFAAGLMGLAPGVTVLQTVGAAMRMAAVASMPFVLTTAALALGFAGLVVVAALVGAAIGALVTWLQQGGSFSQHFSNQLDAIQTSATETAGSIFETVKGFIGFGGSAKEATSAAASATEGLTGIETGANAAATGMSGLEQPASRSADALSDVGTNSGSAATGVGKLGTSGGQAANAMSSLAGNLASAAAEADRAASSFDRAAEAAGRLAAAKARAGGGGGDSGGSFSETISSFFSRGGQANTSRSGMTTKAPLSAFANAPRFAGGTANTSGYPSTLPGGGIAAVLHPNEAVIPLAGGGSVPISVSGGGGQQQNTSGPQIMQVLMMSFTMLSDIKIETTRVWEAVDQLITTVKSEWAQGHSELQTIAGRIYELDRSLSRVADQIAKIGLSGGGGSYGGGSSGGGGTSADGIAGDVTDARRQIAMNDSGTKSGRGFGGGIGYLGSDGKFYASYDYSPDKQHNDSISAQNNNIIQGLVDKYGPEKTFATLYPGKQYEAEREHYMNFYNDKFARLGHYKMGSPNASMDERGGGFTAVLHKDEAVIPLPDGRSVPVSFPRGFMEDSIDNSRDDDRRPQRAGGTTPSSSGGRPVYNITMNIQTPDADSFRRSQGQMVNELRTKLDRSKTRNGPARPAIDDPTKRVG